MYSRKSHYSSLLPFLTVHNIVTFISTDILYMASCYLLIHTKDYGSIYCVEVRY